MTIGLTPKEEEEFKDISIFLNWYIAHLALNANREASNREFKNSTYAPLSMHNLENRNTFYKFIAYKPDPQKYHVEKNFNMLNHWKLIHNL